ncbi:MAG: hypothetical protein ABL889_04620, partial [Terricaulis sp.]
MSPVVYVYCALAVVTLALNTLICVSSPYGFQAEIWHEPVTQWRLLTPVAWLGLGLAALVAAQRRATGVLRKALVIIIPVLALLSFLIGQVLGALAGLDDPIDLPGQYRFFFFIGACLVTLPPLLITVGVLLLARRKS